MADLAGILADLEAESAELDELVAHLDAAGWATPTPAAGWTIAHQLGHLAWTDDLALRAITDPAAVRVSLERVVGDPYSFVDAAAGQRAEQQPRQLLAGWREGRGALADALAGVPSGRKIDWFGPPMNAASMATARLMETWAHGQDVADALAVLRMPTARLRHVAHLGVRTRDFSYRVHGRTPPEQPFRVELTAPDGSQWEWGAAEAPHRVTGPALDFCLLITRRRHRDDLAVRAEGAAADEWLEIAQAFAGPPGDGRKPGQFR
ncbi:MAG: hypothetical protein QOD45_1331 [Pseudonocardiales bacterium]|jgi:uncharacterized protein (TIGR03084 family)|nr:hypothetical protein [Pseudonocardiales bacterium]